MRVNINTPEIALLREEVERRFGNKVLTRRHFASLSESIVKECREYLSDTTLQRVWRYKSGYETVAVHTLNVLSRYVGYSDWTIFCAAILNENEVESIEFRGDSVDISLLKIGDTFRIGWYPNRSCVIKYIGNFRFEAIETHNSKLSVGDCFTCRRIQKGREMCLDNLVRGTSDLSYIIGTQNGITMLEVL